MTQPPEPAGHMPLQVGAGLAPGPDGKAWVQLHINYGPTQTALLIPEDTAAQAADAFAQLLTKAAADAHRANIGLIIPGNGHTPMPPLGVLPGQP